MNFNLDAAKYFVFIQYFAASTPKLYNARHPERTLLYQTVAEHYETWLHLSSAGQFDGQADHRTPKPYVIQAFAKYQECGIFARARCTDCAHDYIVAFSCKGRGVCPITHSADIRHMLDHIGVQPEPPNIAPARGPPMWEDCDELVGEGAQAEPNRKPICVQQSHFAVTASAQTCAISGVFACYIHAILRLICLHFLSVHASIRLVISHRLHRQHDIVPRLGFL